MRFSEPFNEVAQALVIFQANVMTAKKDSENPVYGNKYADLSQVMAASQEAMAKAGLALTYNVTNEGVGVKLTPFLFHRSGQFIEYDAFVVLCQDSSAQGQGSAITYGRRYLYQTILGVAAEEDDDGNQAVGKPAPSELNPRSETIGSLGDSSKGKTETQKVKIPTPEESEYRATVLACIGEYKELLATEEKRELTRELIAAGVDKGKLDAVRDKTVMLAQRRIKPQEAQASEENYTGPKVGEAGQVGLFEPVEAAVEEHGIGIF